MKLLSVIIPVYNSEKYLKKCLDSILSSSYKNLEIICINDGSTDNSLKILKEYQKIDNRIIILNKENEGPQKAREKGYKICKGEYITNIDSDDWIENNSFELAINMLEKYKLSAAVYDAYFWYSEKEGDRKKINKIEDNSIISGEEACIYSLDWSISGLGIFKREVLLNSINIKKLYNGDEVIARSIFLNSEKVGCSAGKYFYRMNNFSLTRAKEFNPKSIETILSNLEIIKMMNKKELKNEKIDRFREVSISNIIMITNLLLKHKKVLTNLEEYKKIIFYGIREIEHRKFIIYMLKKKKIGRLIKIYKRIYMGKLKLKMK